MNATLGHDQRLEFKSDQNLIRLDIPPAGITTSDEGWRITPLGPAVVCSAIQCTISLTKLHTPTILIGIDYRFCCICVGEWGAHFHIMENSFYRLRKRR